MKKILVTGGSGLIGSYFLEIAKKNKDFKIIAPSHRVMDITKLDSVNKFFREYRPDAVVHFAAFRNASIAETQRGDKTDLVWKVNVKGSSNIAKVSQILNSYLIYISTDYVFSGHTHNKGPYHEKSTHTDSNRLLSWYGVTKREGEKAVMAYSLHSSIIRICNISRPGNSPALDYVGKILWLYNQKKIYPMFNDQMLSLTYIPDLVDSIFKVIDKELSGIFHVSTKDLVTPHELANYLIEKVTGKKNQIPGISIDKYLKDNPKRYPKYGGLNMSLSEKHLGINAISWKQVVDKYIKAL